MSDKLQDAQQDAQDAKNHKNQVKVDYLKNRYRTDPDFRRLQLDRAKAYYQKKKAAKPPRINKTQDINAYMKDYQSKTIVCKECGKSLKQGCIYRHRRSAGHKLILAQKHIMNMEVIMNCGM